MRILSVILLSVISYISNPIVAQQKSEEQLKVFYDSIVGTENLPILNGVELIEPNRVLNQKYQYFQSGQFLEGSVSYDGQNYNNLNLRFDLYRDLLFAKLDENIEGTRLIELIKQKVNGFRIQDHNFKNVTFHQSTFDSGFYEILFSKDGYEVLKKPKLRRIDKRDKNIRYYEFEKISTLYLIKTPNSKFYEVKKSEFNNLTGNCSDLITDFFKSNRDMSRDNEDRFSKELASLLLINNCQLK